MTAQSQRALASWLDVLGCPSCHSPLRQDGEGLVCINDGHRFPILNGIPSLVRQQDRARLEAFSRRYRQLRLDEGWQPLTVDQALALPFGSPPGYLPLYWEVRRQTFAALTCLLARDGPSPQAGPVVDLGAGTGWLAYRLAQTGYRIAAVEASLDKDLGLQRIEVYGAGMPERLFPVQGDLEHPPLARGKTSLILLNASLHYAHDLEQTLQRLAGALQPEGCLIVLDTPISQRPHPGTGTGDRHLGREELQQALLAAGLEPCWMRIPRNWRWWAHQVKAGIKGNAPFAFPMVRACKANAR